MAMNTEAIFTKTGVIGIGQVSAANTNRDGTGTIVDIVTGAADQTRIHKIRIKAVGTTIAGMIRLYISDGTNTRLWTEMPVTAVTPSATLQSFEQTIYLFGEDALVLPTNYKLRASTEKAETFNIFAEGANFS
jgi:hypothetical protein